MLTFLAILPCTFSWVLGIRANALNLCTYTPISYPLPFQFLPHYFTVFFIPDSLYLFALYYTAFLCLYISFIHSLYFTYYILYALLIVCYFYILFALYLYHFTAHQIILPLVTLYFVLHTLPPLTSCFINTAKNFNGHKIYVMNNTKVNFTIDAAAFVNTKGANFSGLTRHAQIDVQSTEQWGKGLTPLFSQLVQSMFKGIAKGQPIEWAMSVENESGSVLVEGSEVMKGDSVSTAKAIFKAIRVQFAPEVEGLDMQNLPKISAIKQAYKDAANKRLTFEELCQN